MGAGEYAERENGSANKRFRAACVRIHMDILFLGHYLSKREPRT